MHDPVTAAAPRLGFIGAGRLASALALALQRAGLPVCRVASRHDASAQHMAQQLTDCQAVSPQALVDDCALVFITTPDAAIAQVAQTLSWRAGQQVVHCSGATPVAALQAARQAGAQVGGFHPMQAFGVDAGVAADSLPGCTVAIEADDPDLRAQLGELATRLGCKGLNLPPDARVRYHASGTYAAQHIHVLMAEAVRLWQSWGATEQQALDALLPLLRGTLESLAHSGVAAGMPGPVSRGDVGTIQQHRHALQELDPAMCQLYDQLGQRGVRLAVQADRLDPTRAQAMLQLLRLPPE